MRMEENSILEQRRQARLSKHRKDVELLEFHRAAVDLLCGENSEKIRSRAMEQVNKWECDGLCNQRYIKLWRDILLLPNSALRISILRDDVEGIALRQNSPLGFLRPSI